MIRIVIAGFSIALVAGCAVTPPPKTPSAPDRVKTSLDEVLARDTVLPPHSVAADVKAVPAKMAGERITIRSYVGDASNLLSRLAKARGMSFRVNGPEPRLPLLVTVDVESVGLEDLLAQVGFQFGQRADLVLGDSHIEIRYRGIR